MVKTRGRPLPAPRIAWATVVVGCVYAMFALTSCPTGSAFLHTTSINMLLRQHERRYTSTSSVAVHMIPSMPEDINQHTDEESVDDDVHEEDDVHPSVAWLYPPAKNSGGSSKKSTRPTLAVDYGTYRVGLAIGVGISPRVVPGITNHGSDLEVVRKVLVRARGEGVRDIVVGLPLIRNGTECEMCRTVRSFACVLADAGSASSSPVNVFLWDERFSSAQAEAMLDANGGGMGNKVEIDSLAASFILEHYFTEGGVDKAERIIPSSVASPEVIYAAGRAGQGGEEEEYDFGEASRRKLFKQRADSIRSMAEGEEYVPMMRAPKKKRKRRR